ncbi:MAG: hypothetical protein WCH44_08750, partial [Betaproteobacteria bacterium]
YCEDEVYEEATAKAVAGQNITVAKAPNPKNPKPKKVPKVAVLTPAALAAHDKAGQNDSRI